MLTQPDCSLSPAGIASLAAALPLTLKELVLRGNAIGEDGIVALAARLPPLLEELDIGYPHSHSEAKISPDAFASLAISLPHSVSRLSMSGLFDSEPQDFH